jgi:molybdate transport system ATP-binding protein
VTFAIEAALAARDFRVALEVGTGETVAVLGPNGAGKSTLLAIIAGLLRPDSGRAELDGSLLFDLPAGDSRDAPRRRYLQPHARGVSLLAQDPLLFPHLSALENVAFGPRSSGSPRRDARSAAGRWLSAVDAAEFASRHPAELSGGQAQRVAVARALASEPGLLLLDEPMAALDVAVAPALRKTLKRVLADRSAIIVSHDMLDALVLADRVIVMENGRIVESGPTRQVFERPRTRFAAGLAGLTLLTGVKTVDGLTTSGGVDIRVAETDLPSGTAAAVALRPSVVTVSRERPRHPSLNVIEGRITDLEPRGDVIRVRSDELSADLSPATVADLDLANDDPVWFAFETAETVIYAL